jgi:hypothetical protein
MRQVDHLAYSVKIALLPVPGSDRELVFRDFDRDGKGDISMLGKKFGIALVLLAAVALSACGASDADLTPTVSVGQVSTQAVMTYQVQLTQTEIAKPTMTPTATLSPTPAATFSLATAGTPAVLGTAAATTGAGASACYGMAFVDDVTIPDGTQMSPGESFTKTWQVSNTGTCAWEAGFTFNPVSGDSMGGTAVTLNQRVEPGTQYEFSVPMVAPTNKTGEVTSTWQMADAQGNYFGDQIFVKINVGGGGSAATATTAPATATETATP